MKSIDTVFFDWGGVIADDPGDEFLALLLRDIGANEVQIAEIIDTYMVGFMKGELSEQEYWDTLREHYGFDIHESISEEFQKWRGLVTNNRVFEQVGYVKSKGVRTALLTNVIEPTYNVIATAGYYDHFDVVIASCKVGMAKPEENIYQLALSELQTTAGSSLFIDDKQKNIDPAIKLGFQTILAENPDQIIADLHRYL